MPPARIPRPPRHLVFSWLALLALFAGNIGLAQVNLGGMGIEVELAICVAMAAIVLGVFMELGRKGSLFWVFAGAGFFWLAILLGLTALDYLTRYSYAAS